MGRTQVGTQCDRSEYLGAGLMSTFRQKTTVCPHCNVAVSADAAVSSDQPPKKGDFTVCINCAVIMVFTEDLALKEATLCELAEMLTEQPEDFHRLIQWHDGIQRMRNMSWS